MATIARTEQMFFGAAEAETGARNLRNMVVRFLMHVMTPAWVFSYAEDLAEEYNQPEK